MKSTKTAVSSGDIRSRVWHNRIYGFKAAKYMSEMRHTPIPGPTYI